MAGDADEEGAGGSLVEEERTDGDAYRPPMAQRGRTGGGGGGVVHNAAPSQTEEIQELSVLSKDAAELLWEMVAMGSKGAEVTELRERSEMLRSQLRGLINDYATSEHVNEALLAGALEAFEMLTQCLDSDQKPPSKAHGDTETADRKTTTETERPSNRIETGETTAEEPPAVSVSAPTAPAAANASGGDAPLISLD